MSFLNVGNAPEEIIVEEKELENDLPTPELEDENSPEIAPKPFHEKNVASCGSDVRNGEWSKNSTRTGGPRGWVPKFATGLIYQIRYSSKTI